MEHTVVLHGNHINNSYAANNIIYEAYGILSLASSSLDPWRFFLSVIQEAFVQTH
jgi:hypothetical protein